MSNTIERAHSGTRMSQINIHNGVVYLAGQVGEGDGIEAQTKDMLSRVDKHLAEAGSSKSRILSATIWCANMERDFAGMNSVWDAWIDPANPPARACGESRLATDQYLVEVIIVAAQD